MGFRAARLTLVTLAACVVVAVPTMASATPADRDAKSQKTEAKAGHEAEPKSDKAAKAGQGAEKSTGKPEAAPTTSPQPKSNADLNKGGANNGGDCGAYCSTRDGSPSQNGKGDGEAKGKPCAGCVGKADNKNPPGQAPDGTDHNAGYECDRNQGIGQTNPAHTGCTPAPTVAPTDEPCVPTNDVPCDEPDCVPTAEVPCDEPDCVPTTEVPCDEPDCVPTTEVPCDEPDCVPTEQEPCTTPTPSVGGTETERPVPTVTPEVKGVRYTRNPNPPAVLGGRLPTTGSTVSVGLLLLLGFGLVAAGIATTVAGPARQH